MVSMIKADGAKKASDFKGFFLLYALIQAKRLLINILYESRIKESVTSTCQRYTYGFLALIAPLFQHVSKQHVPSSSFDPLWIEFGSVLRDFKMCIME